MCERQPEVLDTPSDAFEGLTYNTFETHIPASFSRAGLRIRGAQNRISFAGPLWLCDLAEFSGPGVLQRVELHAAGAVRTTG